MNFSPHNRFPPGPVEAFNPAAELFGWIGDNFNKFGDIFRASVFAQDVYVTRDPRHAQQVLQRNWQNYKKGHAIKRVGLLLGNGLMVSEGEFWKQQRRMIQPAFIPKMVGEMIGAIRDINLALVTKWELAARENQPINVTRDISLMVLEAMLVSIFGDDYNEMAPHFRILSDKTARDLKFAREFTSSSGKIMELAVRRRARNAIPRDILGVLMTARDRDSGKVMQDQQLVNEVITLIVAGHETTASTLNLTWYLLSEHSEVDSKLALELLAEASNHNFELDQFPEFPYTQQVLEEVLRLFPAGWLMTRRALKDDHLGNYFVPAKTEIYISPYFIHRNPSLWDAPDTFNPDRFKAEYSKDRHPMAMLPFSAGPRNCIGEYLARVEMQIHLMTAASRLRLRFTDVPPLEFEAEVNFRSIHDFIAVPQLRIP